MNARQGGRRERHRVVTPAGLKGVKERAALTHEALDVDCHTGRPVRFELLETLPELGHRAVPVATPPVVKAHPDLEDALVEVANRIRLDDPDPFERFMLLEEFLMIELRDSLEQGSRRRVIAPACARRRRLLWRSGQAEAWLPSEARTLSPSGEAAGSSR